MKLSEEQIGSLWRAMRKAEGFSGPKNTRRADAKAMKRSLDRRKKLVEVYHFISKRGEATSVDVQRCLRLTRGIARDYCSQLVIDGLAEREKDFRTNRRRELYFAVPVSEEKLKEYLDVRQDED